MKFFLNDYQREVTDEVIEHLGNAAGLFKRRRKNRSAVVMAAPTGAGKTVIASAVLEQLLFGGSDLPANKNLRVLWLTDDPSLNEQSRDKILRASSHIQPHQIVTIDSTYDQETMSPGIIHFLNIGRLTKGATAHVATGDGRQWSLWQTIGNTLRLHNEDFLLVVDEAHRGSGTKLGDKKTIMRMVMDGGAVEFPDASGVMKTIINEPVGVMLGISATPKKFEDAMNEAAAGRTMYKVSADLQKVRDSGMIKDLINVSYPTDNQPTDDTLVRAAVRDLIEYDRLWALEAESSEGAHRVKPLLVVQVPDKVSDDKIQQLASSMTDEWPDVLRPETGAMPMIAHSFGEKQHLVLSDGRMIPYVAPQNIQENQHIRVVIFKAALTTGWDCPRAEVMVSLRVAKEHTIIAQLIGRMVRTPVAARIETDGLEELNTVSLYLPHYSREEVARVVDAFIEGADVEIPVSINPVVFERVQLKSEDLWDMELPKERKPARTYKTETHRLNALGTRLDNLNVTNPDSSSELLVEEVEEQVKALLLNVYTSRQAAIDKEAQSLLEVTYDKVGYDQYTGKERVTTALSVRTSAGNIRELKARATTRMPDGSGYWLYDVLYERFQDHEEAVVTLSAMAADDEVILELEAWSAGRVDSWRRLLTDTVARDLDTDSRRELDEIWHPHGKPIGDIFKLPKRVKTKTQKVMSGKDGKSELEDIETFKKHLFVDANGDFPMIANSWEKAVLEKELKQPGLIGWYRNPSSGAGGLSVSYNEGGVEKSLYPDFLFFVQVDGKIVVDIVDPHSHGLADTPGKWSSLARFARENAGTFRRVTAVIENKAGAMKSLELTGRSSTVVEDRLKTSSGAEDISAVFDEFGSNY